MSGKGSNRRPTQISEEEAEANWQRIFGKHKESNPIEDSQKDRQNVGNNRESGRTAKQHEL
jgi:hypothetical protein